MTYAIVLTLLLQTPPAPAAPASKPLVLVHYMPWYVAKPVSPVWGWHWTMGAFDPEKIQNGKRPIASHYTPLIGPYDSGDAAIMEYHFLLMKLAGIDGVIVDWYGRSDLFDYAILHRNTQALFAMAAKVGLKVGICYEDQTISRLVEAGKIKKEERVSHAKSEINWLEANWFREGSCLKHDGKPVLLSFGFDGLSDAEWEEVLPNGQTRVIYLSEHRRRASAAGAFDWPVPKEGVSAIERFEVSSRDWPKRMPVAYPRFHDIYAEAKLHESYGRISDDEGKTFVKTLERALKSGAPFVQIATWNDWGEGTNIEPSAEFGYRDLEVIQRFTGAQGDLKLARQLWDLRQRSKDRPELRAQLDGIARSIAKGDASAARKEMEQLVRKKNAP